MASLNYEILTDPVPLQVPEAGEEVRGTVHIVVSNPTFNDVIWHSVKIRVPVGPGAGDLTADPKAIKVRVGQNTATRPGEEPAVDWDLDAGVLTVTAKDNTYFQEAGALALVLDGFPVSDKPGLVLLHVTERAASGVYVQKYPVTLSLLKREARVPRNFRPKQSLVASGQDVVLRWDGPDTFTYAVQGPDGSLETVTSAKGPDGWEWSPKPGQEPRRDATYTLLARAPGSQRPGYYLTTGVHLRSPEFETVTARDGVRAPWVEGTSDKGRVVFTSGGVRVLDDAQALGTVSAATVDAETVAATSVRGRDSGAGWIRFPSDGITVGHGGGGDLGTVTADKVRVNGVNTTWVGDVDGGKGWIEFPQSGIDVRKDGRKEWGLVSADKADLNGVNTKWVQGPTASDGWIEFPAAGLNVFQGAGSRQWGTVAADTADLNDLVTHRARVKERLTLQGGLTVDNVLETQDGPPRLIVHGRLDAEGAVHAAQRVEAASDLFVRGNVRVDGKTNANGHLSVRNGTSWIMHTNDELIAVQANLRVHGAFRADS
ncbi:MULTISPECIES: hypothetical protein [unclassified Streptomyces]|uniref:hypothetical protein n=1 Tax=unclassified Streptomyces TaxID=2593676 RepID=UPI00344B5642